MSAYLSLKDHVYQYISNAIKEGKLEPNEKINEKLVMSELQISSTPVREALIELSVEGFLKNIPRKGFFVRPVDDKRVKDLYRIIGNLDALCATESLKILTDEDFDTMQSLVEKMDEAIISINFVEYYELQNRFHEIYCEKCDNIELIHLIHNLKKMFIRQSYENIDNDNLVKSLLDTNEEHKKILDLMRNNKKAKLEKYIRDIHWDSRNSYFDLFE